MGFFGLGSIIQEIGTMIRHDKDIANGWLNNAWAAKQNKKAWNRNLWATSTAHQREVADLEAAGLNPVLSAGVGGGAPAALSNVPPIQMGRSSGSGADFAADINNTRISKAQAAMLKTQGIRNLSEAKFLGAQAEGVKADNIIKLLKSKWFNGLQPSVQADIFNSMMYPSNLPGQMRGTYMQATDFFEKMLNRGEQAVRGFVNSLFPDSGSNAGHNSSKAIENSEKQRENINRSIKWLKGRDSSGGFF